MAALHENYIQRKHFTILFKVSMRKQIIVHIIWHFVIPWRRNYFKIMPPISSNWYIFGHWHIFPYKHIYENLWEIKCTYILLFLTGASVSVVPTSEVSSACRHLALAFSYDSEHSDNVKLLCYFFHYMTFSGWNRLQNHTKVIIYIAVIHDNTNHYSWCCTIESSIIVIPILENNLSK